MRARVNALQVEFVNAAVLFPHPRRRVLRCIRYAFEFADRDAAWLETTKVCGDLVGSISRHLKQNAEWQTELLDESKKPLFRICLVAETLD
jgi:hypothetical protein